MSARTFKTSPGSYNFDTLAEFRHACAALEQERYDLEHEEPIQPHELPLRTSFSGWMLNEGQVRAAEHKYLESHISGTTPDSVA